MKHILLITTGGTISSTNSKDGLVPNKNGIIDKFIYMFGSEYKIEIFSLFNLDSSNIQPEEWRVIAQTVASNLFYDGIVITHGTDTMAYTSSILSYMLKNIKIPVVLTGSQLPIIHPLSDALDNLRLAFKMASSGVGGVFIAFNHKIILGTRAVKVRTTSFDAFESVNYDYVAIVDGQGLNISYNLIPQINEEFILLDKIDLNVFLVKLIPGFNPKFLETLKGLHYKGIVIEAFGIGGINFVRRNLIAEIHKLIDEGMVVVVCSQCLYEKSDLSIYQTGRQALQAGVIEAFDMTTEACVTKLMWALGNNMSLKSIKKLFETNLVGEIKK